MGVCVTEELSLPVERFGEVTKKFKILTPLSHFFKKVFLIP